MPLTGTERVSPVTAAGGAGPDLFVLFLATVCHSIAHFAQRQNEFTATALRISGHEAMGKTGLSNCVGAPHIEGHELMKRGTVRYGFCGAKRGANGYHAAETL